MKPTPARYSVLRRWRRSPQSRPGAPSRYAVLASLLIGSLLGAAGAEARCGDPSNHRSQFKVSLPFLPHEAQADAYGPETIVGLWHVTYTASDGTFFYEAFDHWHGDGTEFENANFNPIEGDVCLGIWKSTGPRSVQLNHFGWNYDSGGNSMGTFNLTEKVTLGKGARTYTGTFDYTVYDTAGNLVPPVLTGTIAATRITMETHVEK